MKSAAKGILCCLAFLLISPLCARVFDDLGSQELPLVVRQEKALNVLSLWRFMSEEFAQQFSPGDQAGIDQVSEALNHLVSKTAETSATISGPAEHYLTYVLAKKEALNRLDFSDESLRKFYDLNPAKYPCEARAVVSEFQIPLHYLNSVSSGPLLLEIKDRLTSEPFKQVAYDVTSRFQKPMTGGLGEVTAAEVGERRFALYQQVVRETGLESPAGPFQIDQSLLFLVVHNIVQDPEECWQYYKERVVQDYGRVWLQKIHNDTLTTLTQELSPTIYSLTTSTKRSDRVLQVADHNITLGEARSTLPFLMGDTSSTDFWKSIQRQALEIELFYHSGIGSQIRQSQDFQSWVKILSSIRDAEANISAYVNDDVSTDVLEDYYHQKKHQYAAIGQVSYTLYKCAGDGTLDSIKCAARLSKLRSHDPDTVLPQSLTSTTLNGVSWNRQSREIQVAIQSLNAGEWSQVFTEEGVPYVLRVIAIERRTPNFHEIYDWVKHDYIMEQRQRYWRKFAGLDLDPSEHTK